MYNRVLDSNNCLYQKNLSAQCYFGIAILDADSNYSGSSLRGKITKFSTRLRLNWKT